MHLQELHVHVKSRQRKKLNLNYLNKSIQVYAKYLLFASSTFCMRYHLILYDVYQKITHNGQSMMEKDNNFFLR